MENDFKWLYIGCGNIAESTAKSIEKGNHKIVSVYSRSYEKAKKFSQKHNSTAFKTLDEALSSDFDAAYIATPHTSHMEYTVKVLEHKKPVLCEKSLGISANEVEKMIQASKENNTYLCEAMWTWFSDVAITVKNWVKSGEIGEIKEVYISFCIPGIFMDKKSRVFNPETAGGALLDITVYPITYCYNLFGTPKEIFCNGVLKKGVDYSDKIILKYDGFDCKVKGNFNHLEEKCVIKGSKGKIIVPMFHMGSIATLKNDKGTKHFKGKTDYLTEFSSVAEDIRSKKVESEFVPLYNTIECMKIMDECRRQMNLVYPFEK